MTPCDCQQNRFDPLRNQRGQALVEYILILIVAVALILGLMFQFNTAFQAWANNYFGEYLTCLLETGELPSIGGAPGDSGTCNQFFKPFSLKDGRPSVALNKGKGDGDGKSGGATAGRARARPEGSSSSASSRSRSSGKWGGKNAPAPAINSESTKEGAAAENKSSKSSGPSGGYYSSPSSRRVGSGGSQISGRMAAGGFKKDSEDKKGYTPGTQRSEGYGGSPKRVKLKPARKIATVADEGTPLTFGSFIRILIIAAIIIALVVVVGGQLLQIGKGMDSD